MSATGHPSSPPPLKLSLKTTFPPPHQSVDGKDDPIMSHSPPSRGSFSTVFTSSQHDATGPVESPNSCGSSSSLSPSHGLRKSLSVDSLVQYARDDPFKVGPRPNRVYTNPSGMAPPSGLVFDPPSRMKRDYEPFRQSTRFRGASVTSMGEDYDQSCVGDSDVERSDPLNRRGEAGRRISLKAQDMGRSFVKAGELPLPSRTPTLSSTSSMSSASGTSTSSLGHVPHPQSTLSMQSITRRATNPFVSITPGRTRSGSLGVYVTHSGKPTFVNTQAPIYDVSHENKDVTLIVVGPSGCGKSTAIHKGLKGHGLSEPTTFRLPSGSQDSLISSRYTRRIGRIIHNEDNPDCDLHILEVGTSVPRVHPSSKKGSLFWPDGAPPVDGVIICYDASSRLSFGPVEELLQGYHALKLSTVVLACKSDLNREVDPLQVIEVLGKYDVGLVEVSITHEGKEKMRRSFDWLLRAIFRQRRSTLNESDAHYRNPASPDLLTPSPPWENSRTATPTASSSTASNAIAQPALSRQAPVPILSTPRPPHSPTRARSTGDLLSEHERSKNRDWQQDRDSTSPNGMGHLSNSTVSLHKATPSIGDALGAFGEREDQTEKEKGTRPAPWATLEELLDKLIFLVVSGDDPAFITHFLLTYRRFASPRAVLLAMQKRMRQLDSPSGDPMFACFAQMRICTLLEMWIRDYPHDFAVRGTAGALSALIKSIIAKTHLLHYGSDFLPFLEVLPSLLDDDAAWALKPEDIADESDDSYSLCDDDDDVPPTNVSDNDSPTPTKGKSSLSHSSSWRERERKSSLPLNAKALVMTHATSILGTSDNLGAYAKQLCRDLVKMSQEVNALDSDAIAQEITRMEVQMFLKIKPRDWLQYCLVSGKKDPVSDPIARFNDVSNRLANWVVSLILCHDRPRARAKQIEKFVDVAQKLRTLNNYSALRAFVAGINNSTFSGDETMEIFKSKAPDQAKNLQSWDLLLQRIRAHSAYRMALKNSKGACIPALEVHMADLIGAQEGNPDENPDDPTKIHWGKFNIMGKFISSITQFQAQCKDAPNYAFPERPNIQNLLLKDILMSEELQRLRIAPPEDGEGGEERHVFPRTMSRDPQAKDPLSLRKLIFWQS